MDDEVRDADIAATTPTSLCRAAGGALGAAGFVAAAVAAQIFLSFRVIGWFSVLLAAMIAVGAAAMGLGAMVARARDWAASVAVVLAPALLLLTAAWVVASFRGGVFSMLALMSVGLSLLASVLVPLALKDCERASEARRALAEAGFDLGT
ncbi:MAG: hypothetical protein IT374_09655 [Polyangiaceae bacterium]|nr:hypothetical protein [Polyangiaceae bacterium]